MLAHERVNAPHPLPGQDEGGPHGGWQAAFVDQGEGQARTRATFQDEVQMRSSITRFPGYGECQM